MYDRIGGALDDVDGVAITVGNRVACARRAGGDAGRGVASRPQQTSALVEGQTQIVVLLSTLVPEQRREPYRIVSGDSTRMMFLAQDCE
jgi:hypothetical protein